jgi:hypothetical protein
LKVQLTKTNETPIFKFIKIYKEYFCIFIDGEKIKGKIIHITIKISIQKL